MTTAAHAAEQAARASYGRLVAILASRSRDIAAAEDALADAFARALTRWPQDGVPANPDAWLLTTARNRLTDTQRRDARLVAQEEAPEMIAPDVTRPPDARLKLLFVCAHPAIDRAIHTPLMLQTALGIEAAEIARVFALPASAMAQRLVRAKAKIKASGIPFAVPDPEDMPQRQAAVLEAIYGAYAVDWMEGSDALTGEALYLATLLTELAPSDPEPLGLAALIAYGQSRLTARVRDGVLVPTPDQDTKLWDRTLIEKAGQWLARARSMDNIGRFQLEAATQSVHAHRMITGKTDWQALAQLTDGLYRLYPTLGTAVARAAAIGAADDPTSGLQLLDAIPHKQTETFQPFHATRAHLLAQIGEVATALTAYQSAIALSRDAPSTAYLQQQRDALLQS